MPFTKFHGAYGQAQDADSGPMPSRGHQPCVCTSAVWGQLPGCSEHVVVGFAPLRG